MFNKTLIIGLGLIGGSFVKALRQVQMSKEIFAEDLDEETIYFAQSEGVIDGELVDDLSDFDLIVIATPLSAYEEIFFDLKDVNALVIDLGSVKNFRFKNMPKNFVPCHPIAGSENVGYEHSRTDLFAGKKFVICKENQKAAELALKIGAIPEFLSAEKHDEIYAVVSHLPQFLSFLTAEFSPKNIDDEFFKTAFRIDNSSSEIWRDIFKMNEKNLEKFYEKFFANLERVMDCFVEFRSPRNDGCSYSPSLFFEKNFSPIFFRALVVKAFLEIPEVKTFQTYAGSGFHDFTSIIKIFDYDLKNLLEQNRQNIARLCNQCFDLKSKI
ncbi:MAG: prephenate dehydrogenase/arogenate dehydrogenase family protein [Alphaproteobacteria bacterium]|nr:prephenate dehydrogenase/arogenate dehydrogenase family protein [Alphaproteobacteria bacterium]